ncbi:MAG: hypothetical protein ACPGWR_09260 [Ardenticatenaceae bacterium]
MMTDQDFSEFVEDMMNGDITLRAASLEALWQRPTGDKRFLPYLEQLLHDKTPCVLGLPYVFGEIRWLAAQALAAEREVLGITKPVRLQNVVKPIYTAGISQAEQAAGVEFKWGVEGVLENLAILRDMGYLPMCELNLSPSPKSSLVAAPSPTPVEQRPRQLELVPALT